MHPTKLATLTLAAALLAGAPAHSQTLRVAMTAADLPTVTGIPNNGGEGFRFLGYPAYDSIINWDFTHTDQLADVAPGQPKGGLGFVRGTIFRRRLDVGSV